MNYLIFVVCALAAGSCIALQASANSKFRANIGSPLYASFFSICGTIITAVLGMLLIRPTAPSAESIRSTQWWNWIGGPLGALFVLSGATLVSELGAALFLSLVVGGQLLCSMLLDHFALMGLPEQPLTMGRAIGALLVVAGVVCIKFL